MAQQNRILEKDKHI